MTEGESDLDFIEGVLDLLQTSGDLVEEAAGARSALFDDSAIYLQVERDKLDVLRHSRVYLPLIQLDGEGVWVILHGGEFGGDLIVSRRCIIHWRQKQG